MIAHIVNGKRLQDIEFKELADALAREIFLEFMDYGRPGLRRGCENAVDTLAKFSALIREKNSGKPVALSIPAEKHRELVDNAVIYVTDSVIMTGMKGIVGALYGVHNMVVQEIK